MRTGRDGEVTLDRVDRHILDLLQRDGRMSMTELADRVGLTVTPCIERVRRLEREGVITGYYARVSPAALGAGLLVFVEITMSHKSDRSFEDFRRELLEIPYVQECHLDRKSTRLNSSHVKISYAVFCLKKKNPIILYLNLRIAIEYVSNMLVLF